LRLATCRQARKFMAESTLAESRLVVVRIDPAQFMPGRRVLSAAL
jgi:hypothetical protein